MNNDKYQVVIGLEVHTQLSTRTKLFCSDTTLFGNEPNTQISPISLAHPGTLPKLNKTAVEYAVKLGIALGCTIQQHNYFARKNYFYPDLPKGYQVSQHTVPICLGGHVSINTHGIERKIKLNRIHMEEDAGKSIHDANPDYTCIDLNRAGVPLLEIVSEPDIFSADEAYAYMTELRRMVRWLGICDGNMEQGSMRCDANISVRLKNETKLGTRVEVKNLNSIRNVKRAIELETARLIDIIEKNETVTQETRSFDADKGTTFSLRTKEEADDYRYFPEPDLPPVFISDKYVAEIKSTMPVLPAVRVKKYINEFSLSEYDAAVICADKEDSDYFESLVEYTKSYKAAANWLIGPLKAYCNESHIALSGLAVEISKIAGLINMVAEGKISFTNASGKVLTSLIAEPAKSSLEIATGLNLLQETDSSAIEQWVEEVIKSMPDKVKQYNSGKKGLIGLFAGEVKKLSKGKADMELVNKYLAEKLNR